MNDAVSKETSSTAASEASQKPSAQKSRHLPAGALFGDYSQFACPDQRGPHCNGTYAPQWLNWPKRCERALRRHFIAQVNESLPLDLARAGIEQMEGPGTPAVKSSVRRGASAAACRTWKHKEPNS